MSDPRRDRFSAWADLDALVSAELDALEPRKEAGADESDPAFEDEPFDQPEEADDEEAFIERTAAWLRDRPDAGALLDAVRAALDGVSEAPPEEESPEVPSSDGEPGGDSVD